MMREYAERYEEVFASPADLIVMWRGCMACVSCGGTDRDSPGAVQHAMIVGEWYGWGCHGRARRGYEVQDQLFAAALTIHNERDAA